MKDLTFSSALQIAEYIRNGDISSEEITRHYIDRIETRDSEINAVPVRTFEQGIADAKAADQARAQGKELGPLHGVPMTINCLLYTSPSPRDKRQSRMPSSA